MYLDESYIFMMLWIPIAYGIYRAFKKHGDNEYNEGMADAICMYHSGRLTYEVIVNENGVEDIRIDINGGAK